jgi:2-polyprenyl-3-methyl-5-hydroxy-6-metoxy-1,4-benzoquinol methylase
MASSFVSQIPLIIHLIQKLKPSKVLDIGKGFGKYGFLLHEYVGIDNKKKIDAEKFLNQQSSITIDAVEVDPDLMLPHLSGIYNKVYFGDILEKYKDLPEYDVILMIDIIEHINKEGALLLLKHLLEKGSFIVIATPIKFFKQELFESVYEHHISHWTYNDFKNIGHLQVQYLDSGAIYLLSNKKINIRGFGNSFLKKIRRVARAIKNEL